MIMFHSTNHKSLKHFYLRYVSEYWHLFPDTVSYGRFMKLEKLVIVQFVIFVKKCMLGKCIGISFVDSTLLSVCRNQRIHMHKVFKDLAQCGKCFLGGFYGFKPHLSCNDKGEILIFMNTPDDVDDHEPLKIKSFVAFIYGKLVDNKGYIVKDLFCKLFIDGIQLITKQKNNIKGGVRSMSDKILLRNRAILESINDELKDIAQIIHDIVRSRIL